MGAMARASLFPCGKAPRHAKAVSTLIRHVEEPAAGLPFSAPSSLLIALRVETGDTEKRNASHSRVLCSRADHFQGRSTFANDTTRSQAVSSCFRYPSRPFVFCAVEDFFLIRTTNCQISILTGPLLCPAPKLCIHTFRRSCVNSQGVTFSEPLRNLGRILVFLQPFDAH